MTFTEWKSEQYKDQSTEEKMEFVEHLHNFPEHFKKAYEAGEESGFQKGIKARINTTNISDCPIKDEWHYMKDVNCYEDLHFPPEEEKGRVLIWKVQVITEKGIKQPVCYHCGSYDDLWYEINAYHVIAWKEIVLPEESEEC